MKHWNMNRKGKKKQKIHKILHLHLQLRKINLSRIDLKERSFNKDQIAIQYPMEVIVAIKKA